MILQILFIVLAFIWFLLWYYIRKNVYLAGLCIFVALFLWSLWKPEMGQPVPADETVKVVKVDKIDSLLAKDTSLVNHSQIPVK